MADEEGSFSVKALPWSGKQEDWPMWSTKFLMRGISRGYEAILEGRVQVLSDEVDIDKLRNPEDNTKYATAEQKRTVLRWRQLNKEGYVDLIMSMSDVRSFNLVREQKQDLYGAWRALCEEFEPSTGDALVELLEEYNSCKLENVKLSVSEYLSEMELKRQRIKLLGQEIPDKMFMIQILASLPKEYILLTSQLKKEVAKGNVTVYELREELKSAYLALKKANGWSEEEIALSAKTKTGGRSFPKQYKGQCRGCGKYGHKVADCWEKNKNKEDRPKNWKSGKYQKSEEQGRKGGFSGKCFKCGETGHKSFECRKPSESANKAKEESKEQEHVMLTLEDILSQDQDVQVQQDEVAELVYDKLEEGVWIGDSGATSHMTNNAKGMYDLIPVDAKVIVGNGKGVKITHRGKLDVVIKQKDGSESKMT